MKKKKKDKNLINATIKVKIVRSVYPDEVENQIKNLKDKLGRKLIKEEWDKILKNNDIPNYFNILKELNLFFNGAYNSVVARMTCDLYDERKNWKKLNNDGKLVNNEINYIPSKAYKLAGEYINKNNEIFNEIPLSDKINISYFKSGLQHQLKSNYIEKKYKYQISTPPWINKNSPLSLYNSSGVASFEKKDDNYYLIISFLKGEDTKFLLSTAKENKDGPVIIDLNRLVDKTITCKMLSIQFKDNKKFAMISLERDVKDYTLDKNIIAGLDLGIKKPIVVGILNSPKRFIIDANSVFHINQQHQKLLRRCSKDKNYYRQSGHGTDRMFENDKKISKDIDNRKVKIIEKWVISLINFLIRNTVGILKMENLSGIKNDKERNRFLKNWPIYKIQSQIEYKCKENGIEIKYINPKNTSKFCSVCGELNEKFGFEERMKQNDSKFKCTHCDKNNLDIDYNASLNVAKSENFINKND